MSATFGQYAAWYDAFNRDKDYAGEVRYLRNLVKRWNAAPRSWLDLGCGSGNHLAALQAPGLRVEGVDASASMIEQARARLPSVPFHVGSLQTVQLPGRFDVISMLFHVMSYQTSDAMVAGAMHRAAAHLADKGLLVFDFWHSDAVTADPPTQRTREVAVNGRKMFRISHPAEDRARHRIDVRFEFRWDHPDGELLHEEHHAMRHFSARELDAFVQAAGLRVVAREGWMRNRPLTPADWYGVICARRFA